MGPVWFTPVYRQHPNGQKLFSLGPRAVRAMLRRLGRLREFYVSNALKFGGGLGGEVLSLIDCIYQTLELLY